VERGVLERARDAARAARDAARDAAAADAARFADAATVLKAEHAAREAAIAAAAVVKATLIDGAHDEEVAALRAELSELERIATDEQLRLIAEHNARLEVHIEAHAAKVAAELEVHNVRRAELDDAHVLQVEAHLSERAAHVAALEEEHVELSEAAIELHLSDLRAVERERDDAEKALKAEKQKRAAERRRVEAAHTKATKALKADYKARLRNAKVVAQKRKQRSEQKLTLLAEEHKAALAALDSSSRDELARALMKRTAAADERREAGAKRRARQEKAHAVALRDAAKESARLAAEHKAAKGVAARLEKQHVALVATHASAASDVAQLKRGEAALRETLEAQREAHSAALIEAAAAHATLRDELVASTEAARVKHASALRDATAAAVAASSVQYAAALHSEIETLREAARTSASARFVAEQSAVQAEQQQALEQQLAQHDTFTGELRSALEAHAAERDEALDRVAGLERHIAAHCADSALAPPPAPSAWEPSTPASTPSAARRPGIVTPPIANVGGAHGAAVGGNVASARGAPPTRPAPVPPLTPSLARRAAGTGAAMDRRVNEQLASPAIGVLRGAPVTGGGRQSTGALSRTSQLRYRNVVVVNTEANAIEIGKPLRFKSGLPRTQRHMEVEDDCVADFAAITAQIGRAIIELRRAAIEAVGAGGAGVRGAAPQLRYLISGHTAADAEHFNRARPVQVSSDRAERVRLAVLDAAEAYAAALRAAGGADLDTFSLDAESVADCVFAKGYGGAFPIGAGLTFGASEADKERTRRVGPTFGASEADKERTRRVEIFVGTAEDVDALRSIDAASFDGPLLQLPELGAFSFADRALLHLRPRRAAANGGGGDAGGGGARAEITKLRRASSMLAMNARVKRGGLARTRSGRDARAEQRTEQCAEFPGLMAMHAKIEGLGRAAWSVLDGLDPATKGVVTVDEALQMYSRLGEDDRDVSVEAWAVSCARSPRAR
jgi:hypothetical protein